MDNIQKDAIHYRSLARCTQLTSWSLSGVVFKYDPCCRLSFGNLESWLRMKTWWSVRRLGKSNLIAQFRGIRSSSDSRMIFDFAVEEGWL